MGRVALSVGKKERVRYAKDVRTAALECLRLDSVHAGANHVMGRWNAEIMRLSGFSRFMAKNFLGGDVFGTASWAEAVRYMERAVQLDPNRITHHLDLAEVYRDRNKPGDKEKAKTQFQAVIDGPITDFNDAHYKKEAQDELAKLEVARSVVRRAARARRPRLPALSHAVGEILARPAAALGAAAQLAASAAHVPAEIATRVVDAIANAAAEAAARARSMQLARLLAALRRVRAAPRPRRSGRRVRRRRRRCAACRHCMSSE